MGSRLRPLLVGRERTGHRRYLDVTLAVVVFVVTFVAYALDVFEVGGGIVWIPGDAALVGMVAAAWVGFRRDGLAAAWGVTYAALLGYRADHAFFGLSGRPFSGQLAYFLGLEGLAVLAVEAVLVGTLAFVAGYLVRLGVDALQEETAATP